MEAAHYAELAAGHATQIGAMTEAVNFYRQAHALDPTPGRQLALGHALMQVPGGMAEARETMGQALDTFESNGDQAGIAQVGLRLAASYLSTGQGEQVLYWADRILVAATESDDFELHATAEYLMAAGKLYGPHAMSESDAHYREATRLTSEYNLNSDVAIQSWFGWGNLSVQRGEYADARAKFERTLSLARSSGNIYFESLCYNNLAYAALLGGDVTAARAAVDHGIKFIESNQLLRPRQYLYSTCGEVALTEGNYDAAELWFGRAIKEARIYDNETHTINVRAHLGRVAWARGETGLATQFLTEALSDIPTDGALYLRAQIELWLADLYLDRNEADKAEAHLNAAQETLAGSQRLAQQSVADRILQRLNSLRRRPGMRLN
jgi:tetratricopeptide (TPR) repeat protein